MPDMPNNAVGILIGLILGAGVCFISGSVIIAKNRMLSCRIRIPLLALCIVSAIFCATAALYFTSIF